MPRANRYVLPGHLLHLTHRCHDRAFLLRFGRDRNAYRSWLREGARRTRTRVLTYNITSNHVHVVAEAGSGPGVARMMQMVEGSVAGQYNRRKGRHGAFWQGRYWGTIIESGTHLWDCLVYVDLNMVRAGVVDRPEDWRWSGCRELLGLRSRYRVVDLDRLVAVTGAASLEDFREAYRAALGRGVARGPKREAGWTESVAVGGREFVEEIGRGAGRRRLDITAWDEDSPGSGRWMLKDTRDRP